MRKDKMITRTIKAITADVMCLDTETADVKTVSVNIPSNYTDEKTAMKFLHNYIDTDTFKAVKIIATTETEILYGMPETEFIKHATILPPR